MTAELFLRYIHFISIFAIVGSLASEYVLLKQTLSRAELNRLAKVDAVYGIAAITLLAAGLTLWLGGFGKPSEFYSKNWIFHLKLTLFILVGLLSIYPTVFFLKNRRGKPDETVTVPSVVFIILKMELALLFIIPVLAGLMSRGIGYMG
ncbi:MAG: DUF2214 family protein [Cyclobacteriaceae bacterium]|nr:DUF2214 family protein [Cyclobacteriaceae bacterium]MDW8332345.1 DUF2214 family protein [Cyclobacteriaceae bacterium]